MSLKRIYAFLLVFGASLLLELQLEKIHKVDSIGLWYTVLVAAICAIVIFTAIVPIASLFRIFRRAKAKRLMPVDTGL
ncbi:hypothetical protein [Pseudoduganella violaceinigra]|uniref:hypothetical protein n=1 Tax=Pseudoduganella violaceinigra TaxID=246602 RepID=UPI000407B42F|nr:hypothetical protein [Pseudoduganella violaceinigra]